MTHSNLIYSTGDPSRCAFLIPKGRVRLQLGNFFAAEIDCSDTIVGTIEFLLNSNKPPPRIFDCFADDDLSVSKVQFESLNSRLEEFKLGLAVNIFLARVLESVSDRISHQMRALTRDVHAYERHSLAFYSFLRDLQNLRELTWLQEIGTEVVALRNTELFNQGRILARKNIIKNLFKSASPSGDFAQVVPKNTVICREDQEGDSLYVLLEGKVVVTRSGYYVATIDQSGEGFGELAMLLHGRRTATLEAIEETSLYVIRRRYLDRFHENHPDVFLNIAATLAERIAHSLDRVQRLHERKHQVDLNDLFSENSEHFLDRESSDLIDRLRLLIRQHLQKMPNAKVERLFNGYLADSRLD